jgi:hypothetical protein
MTVSIRAASKATVRRFAKAAVVAGFLFTPGAALGAGPPMPDYCERDLDKCSQKIWPRDSFPHAGVTQRITFSNGETLICTSKGAHKPRDCKLIGAPSQTYENKPPAFYQCVAYIQQQCRPQCEKQRANVEYPTGPTRMPDHCKQNLVQCSEKIWTRDSWRGLVGQGITFSNGATLWCNDNGPNKPRSCTLTERHEKEEQTAKAVADCRRDCGEISARCCSYPSEPCHGGEVGGGYALPPEYQRSLGSEWPN